MSDRRAAILAIGMLFAAGCGGGSSGGGSHPPTVPTSATTRQAIGNGGGTVSVNFGIYTANVVVPAGALPTTTTVSLTLYGTGHGPQILQSASRSTRSLGTGATELAELVLDTGGEAPVIPLKLSLVGVATPASGISVRLAGYGATHGFTDVDTTTLTGNTATEDDSIIFPDASLASNTLYGFYEIPSANVQAPPTPVITIPGATGLPAASTITLAPVETNGNGFPYLTSSFTYTVSSPSIGTITSPGGVLTTGPIDAAGTIVVTDTTAGRGNPSSTVNVSVGSPRPGAAGDTFAFTGTVSSTQQLTGTGGTSAQTTSGTVTVSSTVNTQTTSGSTATVGSTSMETDTYPLQTIKTTTTTTNTYALAPPFNVNVTSTDATDSNGAEYINAYGAGNGLIDVLPETAGSFGPNTAALTYTENDPANYSRQRVIAANGSYNETGNDPYGDVQTITTNANLSGAYDASQYSARMFTFSAPTGSPAMINAVYTYEPTNSVHNFSLTSWIPASATQPSTETDVDSGSTAFPSACAVPAKYGTTGNKIVQTITRIDAALGNLENEVVTTYTNANYGPVCSIMTDSVNTYYDYTGQYGYGLFYSSAGLPVETTAATETLTLSSATTAVGTLAVKRQTSSTARGAAALISPGFVPLAFARSRFERTVRDRLGNRNITFKRDFFAAGVHAK